MNSKHVKFIGQNLGRGIAAGDNLKQDMLEEDVSISLVQEPYFQNLPNQQQRVGGEGGGILAIYKKFYNGDITRAAIYFKGKPENAPKLVENLSTSDITTAMWRCNGRPLILVSCYLHSDDYLAGSLDTLDEIIHYSSGKDIIIHGDFNSRSIELIGDKRTNNRGRQLEEWLICNNLFVHNKIGVQTFWKEDDDGKVRSSIIDYTLTGPSLIDKVENWHVSSTESLSDHKTIRFELVDNKSSQTNEITMLNIAKADWDRFGKDLDKPILANPVSADRIERFAAYEMGLLHDACQSSIPFKTRQKYRNWWWNNQLQCLKTMVNRSKKRRLRSKDSET